MLQSLRNIWKIKDLRDKMLFTLMMIGVFRIGSFVPCPFVNVENLKKQFTESDLLSGLFGVADMFTGGAFSNMSVMALGIMPYISASIILQLMMVVVPRLEKMAKEGDAGRKKITQYTRLGTVGLAVVQGFGLAMFMLQQPEWITPFMRDGWGRVLFILSTVLSITAGTTFLMWIGEKITEKGIGNGISLLICLGIMAAYPTQLKVSWQSVKLDAIQPIWLLIIGVLFVAVTMLIILIQEGARKIPIQHARQQSVGRKMQVGQTNYLPLKVNTAGVMPVIFSMAILQVFPTVFGWIGTDPDSQLGFLGELFAYTSRYNPYTMLGMEKESIFLLLKAINPNMIAFLVLTFAFCFFYTAIVFNPRDIADNLRRVGAFVPGYRPGPPTANYIDKVMTRITFVGATFLCSVSVIPQFLTVAFNIPFELAQFAGGTGLIIVVAVILDTMKQVETQMLMRHYDGFKSRRQGSGGRSRWSAKERNR